VSGESSLSERLAAMEEAHAAYALAMVKRELRRKPGELDAQLVDVEGVGFMLGVRAWLDAVDVVSRDYAGESVLWGRVFKPWLESLVGWHAHTAPGRAAGSSGYLLLAERWSERWQARFAQDKEKT